MALDKFPRILIGARHKPGGFETPCINDHGWCPNRYNVTGHGNNNDNDLSIMYQVRLGLGLGLGLVLGLGLDLGIGLVRIRVRDRVLIT